MAFLNSAYLWGLLAMVIPLLIHLFNKKNHKKILWAATEFLQESIPQSARSIIPKDLLLLILRMAILGLVAVALAEPMFSFFDKNKNKKVFIFEKDKLVQELYKFELEQANKNKIVSLAFTKNKIESLTENRPWSISKSLSNKQLQIQINTVAREYAAIDSIVMYVKPVDDFYDSPILVLPKNMQLKWAIPTEKPKLNVWKSGLNYFSYEGQIQKYNPAIHKITFEKDSLAIKLCSKNSVTNTYIKESIAAIKKTMAYPIFISQSANIDLSIGDTNYSNSRFHIQTGAKEAGISLTKNTIFQTTAPENLYHSDIRSGAFVSKIKAEILNQIGLKPGADLPTLFDLNASIKYLSGTYKKKQNQDKPYIWTLVLLMVAMERFVSIYKNK